jgi:hypothetical protein
MLNFSIRSDTGVSNNLKFRKTFFCVNFSMSTVPFKQIGMGEIKPAVVSKLFIIIKKRF